MLVGARRSAGRCGTRLQPGHPHARRM